MFSRTEKREWPATAAIVGVSLAAAGCASNGSVPAGSKGKKGEGGGVPVTITTVARRNVPIDLQVVGNVEAYSTITVKAQVGGELTRVHFHEGDFVKAGDLLFTIDPRPYEAALHQAEAATAKDRALLSQAQANLARDEASARYARSQADRYVNLFKQGIISKDQTEQVGANADAVAQAVSADKAAIESAEAAIIASRAAVENVRLQLGYTTIRSPIDGRTGNLAIKQGNVITAGNVDLITINQVQPIYVTFSVPEAQLASVKRYMTQAKLPVMAASQDAPGIREAGSLTFIDNTVDATTGTIKLKGTFANPDRKLWPGEFVRVTLRLTTKTDALVVPNQAIQTGQEGSFVFVVKANKTVESRPVATGTRVDQDVVVDQGLEAGETIVTEGQLRLAPGSRVQIRTNRVAGNRPPA